MQNEKFYIESVKEHSDRITTIKLSSQGGRDGEHIACVTIHGTKFGATQRAIKILGALNESQ